MKAKIAATLALGLGVGMAAVAQQYHPLTVVFDGDRCPPVAVDSVDNSCNPHAPDQRDEACRENGVVVQWTPLERIKAIGKKSDSSGGADLAGCGPNPGQQVYQCSVTGRPGEWVEYYVEGQGPEDPNNPGCMLDPVIRVK